MMVYELRHVFFWHKGRPNLSDKLLGFFRSLETLEEAKAFYSTLPGFRDSTDAFVIRRLPVQGEPEAGNVYEAYVSGCEPDMDTFEWAIFLGLFARKEAAEQAIETFRMENPGFMACPALEFEQGPCCFRLDKPSAWGSGFDIYTYPADDSGTQIEQRES